MKQQITEEQLNIEIVGLLLIAYIPDKEKELWTTVLPKMSYEQKLQLKKDLEDKVNEQCDVLEDAQKKFVDTTQN